MTQKTYTVQGLPIPENIKVLLKDNIIIPAELESALNDVLRDYKQKEQKEQKA